MNKRVRITVAVITLLLVGSAALSLNMPSPRGKYVDAIRLGTEWFVQNQNDEFIEYQYDPYTDEYADESQRLREMGAMWSIAKASNFFGEQRYADLAERGFRFFEQTFKHDAEQEISFVNVTPQKIKLGYNAFVILTMLELDLPDLQKYAEPFVKGIRFLQNEDGSLRTFFYSNRATGVDYYPGEALFALMSLYEKNGDSELLIMTEKAFPFYVDYWRRNKNTGFIPWQTRAYKKLFDATNKADVADFVFEMNDWLLAEHDSKDQCAGFSFVRGNVTSVFMEGVIQAYLLAQAVNDETRSRCYANYVREGADYILKLQITDADRFPRAAIGGFLSSEKSNVMRVDNNQHSITALMEAYEAKLIN